MANKGGIPLYIKVTNLIKKDIVKGKYKESESIGTQSELCERYGASMITIRRALQILEEEGIIETKQGKGTYVKSTLTIDLSRDLNSLQKLFVKQGLNAGYTMKDFRIIDTPERFDDELKKELGDRCLVFTRVMEIQGVISILDVTYVNERYADIVTPEELSKKMMFQIMREKFGIRPGRATQTLSVEYSDSDTARVFGLVEGTPLFVLRRWSYDTEGRFLEYMEDFCEGTAYTFTMNIDLSEEYPDE